MTKLLPSALASLLALHSTAAFAAAAEPPKSVPEPASAANAGGAASTGAPLLLPKGSLSFTVTFKYAPSAEPPAHERPASVSVTKVGKDSLQVLQFADRSVEVWRVGEFAFVSEVGSTLVFPLAGGEVSTAGGADTVPTGTGVADGIVTGGENGAPPAGGGGPGPGGGAPGAPAGGPGGGAPVAAFGNNTPVISSGPLAAPKAVPPVLSAEETDWSQLGEFAWVKPELLRGKAALAGQPVLIYAELEPAAAAPASSKQADAKKWPAGPLGGMPLRPGIRVAAVDESTRLPKVLQLGEDLRQYTFGNPGPSKLEFPPKLKPLLEMVLDTPAAGKGK